jgi:hypothetical protein
MSLTLRQSTTFWFATWKRWFTRRYCWRLELGAHVYEVRNRQRRLGVIGELKLIYNRHVKPRSAFRNRVAGAQRFDPQHRFTRFKE